MKLQYHSNALLSTPTVTGNRLGLGGWQIAISDDANVYCTADEAEEHAIGWASVAARLYELEDAARLYELEDAARLREIEDARDGVT